jgi:hypothetical protein
VPPDEWLSARRAQGAGDGFDHERERGCASARAVASRPSTRPRSPAYVRGRGHPVRGGAARETCVCGGASPLVGVSLRAGVRVMMRPPTAEVFPRGSVKALTSPWMSDTASRIRHPDTAAGAPS